MRKGMAAALAALVLALVFGGATSVARAQGHSPAVSLSAGPSPYDLAGTGTGFAMAGRLDWWLLPFLVVEPGLEYFRYTPDPDQAIGLLMPELSLQGSLRVGPVAPYLGVGAGYAFTVTGRGGDDATLHAVLGVRAYLSDRWGLRGEFRLRSVDPFHGNMGDITAGVSFRL